MLHDITWGSFLGWSLVAVIIYYVIIGAVFYRQGGAFKRREGRKDHQQLGQSKPHPSTRQPVQTGDSDNAEMPHIVDVPPAADRDPIYDHAVALMEDIDGLLYASGQERWDKRQLLDALKKKVRVNAHLQATPLYETVNNYMVRQAYEMTGTEIGPEDISFIWQ